MPPVSSNFVAERPAGWYVDPSFPLPTIQQHPSQYPQRYWDGAAWTDQTRLPPPKPTPPPTKPITGRFLLVSGLIFAALILATFWVLQMPGSQTDTAKELMLASCKQQVAATVGGIGQSVVALEATESNWFDDDVTFSGTYPGGSWECWGNLKDDNELSIHVRVTPAG